MSPQETKVFRRAELLELGLSDSRLRSAVSRGVMERIAPGWYALPGADPVVLRALRNGYRLTCIDALERHGLWVPYRGGTEARRAHAYRYRRPNIAPPGLVGHATGHQKWREPDAVASLPLALEHSLRCLDGETVAILLESAMNRRLLAPGDALRLLDNAPIRVRSRVGILSAASESGSETRVVRALRRHGYRVEQQVFVEGAGYIDAYVSGLFLEIDGREHHSSPDAFNQDRRRDLALRRLGLQLLRLSYEQVWHDWSSTLPALRETIQRVGPMGKKRVRQLTDG